MRHRSCGTIGSAAVLAACLASTTADAQPFGFLFGDPGPGYAAARGHRHHRLEPIPLSATAVPLPPPRPHFANDPARTPGQAAASASAAPVPSPQWTPPAGPPLPPPKPESLSRPESSAKSQAPLEPGPPGKPGADATPPPPAVAPSGANTVFNPRQPDADATCPARLAARNVAIEAVDIGKQPDDRCTIVQPVRLSSLVLHDGTTVTFPDRPTIACTTTDTFAAFVGDLLSPLAKGSYGSAVASVWTGPGFECRSRDHIFGAKLSAHGQGLAVDIAQIKLADGRLIVVGAPPADTDQAFETAARAGACGYFHTVLGPGSDAYHRSHWHFDLEVRGAQGDSKYCK